MNLIRYLMICIFLSASYCLGDNIPVIPHNGGFEEVNPEATSKALKWNGEYFLSADAGSGAFSAQCLVKENMQTKMCDAVSAPFPLKENTAYSFSGSSKGNERYVYIQQLDSRSNILHTQYWKIPESFDWAKFQYEFNTSTDTANGKIYLRVFKTGNKACFDNIQIKELGPDNLAKELNYLELNDTYGRLGPGFVSPHIKWAKPYLKGTVTGLVIAPSWTQRETLELAQRLSFDFENVMTKNRSEFAGAGYLTASAKRVNEDFSRKISVKKDIIVIGGMHWSAFSDEIKKKILENISSGAGLVYTNVPPESLNELKGIFKDRLPDSSKQIIQGLPLDIMPLIGTKDIENRVMCYKYGKGRVVLLNYGGIKSCWHSLTPAGFYLKGGNCFYEYFMSILARACLWSADKYPDVFFTSPSGLKSFERGPIKLVCEIQSGETRKDLTLETSIIDFEGESEFTISVKAPLVSGKNSFELDAPVLKKGVHMVNYRLADKDGKILNWASVPIKINSLEGIKSLKLPKQKYRAGEELKAEVELPDSCKNESELICDFKAYDSLGRLIAEKSMSPKDKKAEFSFAVPAPLTSLHEIRVALFDKSGLLDKSKSEFSVETNHPDDEFRFSGWAYALNEYPSNLMLKQMKKYGFDSVLEASGSVRMASAENYDKLLACLRRDLDYEPQGWTIGPARGENSVLINKEGLPECKEPLTSEEYIGKMRKILDFNINNYTKIYNPICYSLSDEPCLSTDFKDVCFSSSALKSFRAWALKKYVNLTDANRAWNTNFKSWEEVRPITFNEAVKENNYARWIDHRAHMETVLLDTLVLGKNAINDISPKTKVGFDGAVGLDYPITFTGYNWPEMVKRLDYIGTYGEIPMEIARSFAPDGACLNSFTGSYARSTHEMMKLKPWELLFHKGNLLMWWTVFPTEGNGGASAFTPGIEPLPWLITTNEEIKKIKSGIDKLILNSKRANDPIAIHYSNLCAHASLIDNENQNWVSSMRAFRAVLEDSGFQYDYISNEDLEKGELDSGKFKVLILPYSQILSDKEIAAISRFVEKGGLLITDMMPGVRDVHGNLRKNNPLEKLFTSMLEPNRRKLGKGNAILIGTLLRDYVGEKDVQGPPIPGMEGEKTDSAKESEIFTKILALNGLRPRLQIEDEAGNNVPNIEVVYYRFENIPIYVVLPHYVHYQNTRKVKIKFPEKKRIRDLLDNKDMPDDGVVVTELRPGELSLYAVMPEQNASFTFQAGDRFSPGNEIAVKVQRNPRACKTVLRLDVFGPDGEKIDFLTIKKIAAEDAVFQIPLALNSNLGKYRILLTDILAGAKNEKTVEVGK